MNEPTIFRAGDSASWSESLSAYPASAGWSLKYRLIWPTGTAINLTATPAGDDYEVALAASSTASWTAGKAVLVSWVEKGADKVTLEQKDITILPDLTVAVTFDGRSANKKALDAAEASLATYLTGGKAVVAEYEIDGKRMKFRDVAQIMALVNHYKQLVARETAALAMLNGGDVPGRVYYRAGKG